MLQPDHFGNLVGGNDEPKIGIAAQISEAQLGAVLSHILDYAIIGLDASGYVSSWNVGAERLKGYTSAQVVGRHFSIFFTEDERRSGVPEAILEQARTDGHTQRIGKRVRQDGSTFWGDVVITAIAADDGTVTGFVKVTRDLTEQRRLETARTALLTTVTHDLKTPLTAIKLFAEMIEDEDPEVRADYSRRIGARVDHVTTLIDTFIKHVQQEAQPADIHLAPELIGDMLASSVENLSAIVSDRQITVEPTGLRVLADRSSAERALTNLLANAINYSADGSTITVTFAEAAGRVSVHIADRGRGIAAEDMDIIFDEFIRGRLAQSDGGTGLGLASARRLMELQGGSVRLVSVVGIGTTAVADFAAL